ncbi:putative ribonuclease H-like domain-containing protein [Tanacetum coccineum]
MCDKKNNVLFTDTECLIMSPNFKLLDESQVVLRAPRKDDVYSLDLKNIIPSGGITCLYANATADESKLWHRRLGYVNFKNINKLVKGYLVRGLPSKVFMNDHTCIACKNGKQHKASCKAKLERIIRKPLELLHMDLYGHVSVESINKKRYCLVVTDDFSRFSWVTAQAANIKDLKAQIKQLKKKARPVINHHKAWINNPAFDDLDDAMGYMETKDAHDEGTVKDSEETRVSTAEPNEGTAEPKDGNSDESAAPITVFRDDETIA